MLKHDEYIKRVIENERATFKIDVDIIASICELIVMLEQREMHAYDNALLCELDTYLKRCNVQRNV